MNSDRDLNEQILAEAISVGPPHPDAPDYEAGEVGDYSGATLADPETVMDASSEAESRRSGPISGSARAVALERAFALWCAQQNMVEDLKAPHGEAFTAGYEAAMTLCFPHRAAESDARTQT